VLAGPVVLYFLILIVPPKWYMLRYHRAMVRAFVSEESKMAVCFSVTQLYHKYNGGFLRVCSEGTVCWSDWGKDNLVVFDVGRDLSLTQVYGTVSEDEWNICGIHSLANEVSFIKSKPDDKPQIGKLTESGVWYTDFEEGRNKNIQTGAGGMIILRNTNDAVSVQIPGCDGEQVGSGWRGVLELETFRLESRNPVCRVPATMAAMDVKYGDYDPQLSSDITLYTFLLGDGVATNVYRSCYSNVIATTVLGTPEDALFVESVFEEMPGGAVMRPVPRRLKYVAWNRAGLVREIPVPYGEEPEEEVALHTASDGRKYIVTLWAKKARRRSVDLRFTFVDLASGEQIVRDVTVPFPAEGR
jgi:hypothetical protein